MLTEIRGGRVLLPRGEVVETDIALDDGRIARVGGAPGGARPIDARGLLVLPGAVDIHGDAFERQLMPRPEARFPVEVAMLDTDRQLVSNGITTAFHGITYSWEGGLRGRETAIALLESLAALRPSFASDHRVHLRFETHNLDAVEEVIGWLDEERVDFFAFNDHLPSIRKKADEGGDLQKYAERSQIPVAEYRLLLRKAAARSDEVPAAIELLAGSASRAGVAMASHDDYTASERRRYHELGCALCEFPRSMEAAHAAQSLGDAIIMGAPNIVRGGSHLEGIRASDLVAAGMCSVLASDYYYPSLLQAPFRLAHERVLPFGRAWQLVSLNPARAARLEDRGEIRAGRRADLLLVDDSTPLLPRVVATIVAGEIRFSTRSLALH